MRTRYYKVAGHLFAIELADAWERISFDNFKPFEVNSDISEGQNLLFHLTQVGMFHNDNGMQQETIKSISAEGDELSVTYKKLSSQLCHEFKLAFHSVPPCCTARCSEDFSQVQFTLYGNDKYHSFTLSNLIMLIYALSSANKGTLMFHASVIVNAGNGYMFLGKSGTGKSTHASLWLKNISESKLLNDDNPIVRIDAEGKATVYGSPWSGKTPCYRAEQAQVGAIIKLSQASFNSMRQLTKLEAYASVMPAVSSLRWYKPVADGIHASLDLLVRNIPLFKLQCLPNDAAAQLCHKTITSKK